MRVIIFFISVFLISCTATKRELKREFKSVFVKDTGYFKLRLPLYSRSYLLDDEMLSLDTLGYISLIGYIRGPYERPVYKVADKGSKFFVADYYNPDRDSEHIAIFNYYRIEEVKLNGYRKIGDKKDTIEASFKASYNVVPMFALKSNPFYFKLRFIKSVSGWKVQDKLLLHAEVYRNVIPDRWNSRLFLTFPVKYENWIDSVIAAQRKQP